MKGYYLFAPMEPDCVGPQSGVERKVRAQHMALSRHLGCELVILEPVRYTQSLAERIIRRLPFTAGWRKWKYRGEFDGADFLYIRQVHHDHSFVRYLRDIKRANPDMKIIYEIPTWPYGVDTVYTLSNFPFLLKERRCCRKAARYFDRIVTFYGQDQIWGRPCISLINGYDFSSAVLPERRMDGTISLISVSQTAFWHGYERVIKGIHAYIHSGGTEHITYHMVGNIDPEHEKLVDALQLQEHVVFHGRQSGAALAELYQQAWIGIDVLAGHKIDYPRSSSLKSREYGAYGIPLITASPVDYLEQDDPYQLIVPYDDSPLDMQAVVDFYHRIYDDRSAARVAEEIRANAQRRCDIPITMRPIVDYLLQSSSRRE